MHLDNDQEKIYNELSQKTKCGLESAEILLTGGSGFFGKNLLEFFNWYIINCNKTLKLSVLSRNPYKSLEQHPHLISQKNFSLICNDINTLDIPDKHYTHIIHAATTTSAVLYDENPLLMADTILSGTKNILKYAEKNSTKNLLFISSGAVYGKQLPNLTHVSEEYLGASDCTNPAYSYHEAKRMAEMYVNIYSKLYGIQTKIARCFAFAGPYMEFNTHFAIGNFIYDALYNDKILIKGDGTPLRSYLYSTDLVAWLLEILFCGENKKAYNVGSDVEINIRDLAHLVVNEISKITGKKAQVIVNKKPSSMIPERYVPSVQKAKDELNLKIHVSLSETVFKTASWLNKQKN